MTLVCVSRRNHRGQEHCTIFCKGQIVGNKNFMGPSKKVHHIKMHKIPFGGTVLYLILWCCIRVLIRCYQFTFSGLPGRIKDIRQSPLDSKPSGLITPGAFCNYCKERAKRHQGEHIKAFCLNWHTVGRPWHSALAWQHLHTTVDLLQILPIQDKI